MKTLVATERQRKNKVEWRMRERIYGFNVCLDIGQWIDDIELVYLVIFEYRIERTNSIT